MKLVYLALIVSLFATPFLDAAGEKSDKPIRVLLITGGCCHDYNFQTRQLVLSTIDRHLPVSWTIVNKGGTGTKAQIDLYDDPEWAQDYDVVVHNECFANTEEPEYIRRITNAHKQGGVGAVVIHCAMHTYRAAKIDDWREMLGVTSRRHDHQSEYPVKIVAPDHPIMAGFPKDYVSQKDELYIIEKVWPNTTVLATSTSERDATDHAVLWVNQYGKARVFGTTYGHSSATFGDETFLDVVTRGIMWTADRLKVAEPSPQPTPAVRD